MSGYVPHTKEDIASLKSTVGIEDVDELFSVIPKEIRDKAHINLPDGISEMETARALKKLAGKNKVYSAIMRGAGAYNHYIPPVVSSSCQPC